MITLTNVGIAAPGIGIGTDPAGNRVRFTLSAKDESDLRFILLGDLAINFTGVDIDESDVIS